MHLDFPPFSIDVPRRRLTRAGAPVDLSPRLVEILAWLASHPAMLVSKDELLDRFWADVHVTDNTLTRAIADIRKALADDAGAPRFIQTVARRGYRFIAEVTEHRAPGTMHSALSTGPDPFLDWVKGRMSLEALDVDHLADAARAFEDVVRATPAYAAAHAALANARALQYEETRSANAPERDRLVQAIRHARRACELDPALGEAWATLAFTLTAAGELAEARAAARHAVALEPSSWRHQFRLGLATWGEERLHAVDRTLSLLPECAPARFLAVMVFIARQAYGPAAEAARLGATAQSRQAGHDGAPFPPVGLHWLQGLLRLREGGVGSAITAFAREMDESPLSRVYGREFRVNAQIGAGFAHLSIGDPAGAADAFRAALELLPGNGRALVGLYSALSRTSLASDATVLLTRAEHAVTELANGGRPAEAALVRAAVAVARSDMSAAFSIVQRLIDEAPPGQTGWIVPVDPALAPLRDRPEFSALAARLAARAA